MRNTWQYRKGMGPDFWRQEKDRAERIMDAFDELDADLRETVRADNDLMQACGEQVRRIFFMAPEVPAEGRLTRKKRGFSHGR